MIYIRKKAEDLKMGQLLKVCTTHGVMRGLFVCSVTAKEGKDGFATVQSQSGKGAWRLSPRYPVMIPLEDDPVLGGARS